MSATGDGLKTLHELHLRLRAAVDDLERGPRQIQARKGLLQKKQAELEARQQQLKQLKVAADQKALQLKTTEAKIADYKAKLNAVSTNREYDILKSQIAADTMANSVLEDEILECLEKVDQAQADLKQAEQEVQNFAGEMQKFASEVAAAEAARKELVAVLKQQVAEAESIIPASIRSDYQRLVQAYGADAMAPVVNKVCGNCNVGMTPQMLVELRTGQIRFCKICNRLVYLSTPVE